MNGCWERIFPGKRAILVVTLALASAVGRLDVRAAEPSHIQFENRQKQSGVTFVLDNGTLPDKPMICLLYTSDAADE